MSLQGKVIVVTGATSGIGLAVAGQLASQGARVFGVGRSTERCQQAETRLRASTGNPQVTYLVADLSLQREVRRLAGEIRAQVDALDGLVNNAGVVPFHQVITSEGFDLQWALNHLAPFLLTHELLPLLKAAPQSRVVTVSSGSHYGARLRWNDIQLLAHYGVLRAYKQTKLCNVLFTAELNRRLGPGSNVHAFAADPGLVKTDIGLKSNSILARWAWAFRRSGGITPDESARGIVFLLSEPSIRDAPQVYWKHGIPKPPNPYALDEEAARRLWELSARMCGIEPDGFGRMG
jgi:NAD(P)-dependent dehydrogenase (short-subunit alcohol dehydrogenase family)